MFRECIKVIILQNGGAFFVGVRDVHGNSLVCEALLLRGVALQRYIVDARGVRGMVIPPFIANHAKAIGSTLHHVCTFVNHLPGHSHIEQALVTPSPSPPTTTTLPYPNTSPNPNKTSKNAVGGSRMAQVFSLPFRSIYSPPRSWNDFCCISFILANTLSIPTSPWHISPPSLAVDSKYCFI